MVLVLVECDTLDSLYIDMVNKSSCFAVVSMMNNHTKKDMKTVDKKPVADKKIVDKMLAVDNFVDSFVESYCMGFRNFGNTCYTFRF